MLDGCRVGWLRCWWVVSTVTRECPGAGGKSGLDFSMDSSCGNLAETLRGFKQVRCGCGLPYVAIDAVQPHARVVFLCVCPHHITPNVPTGWET